MNPIGTSQLQNLNVFLPPSTTIHTLTSILSKIPTTYIVTPLLRFHASMH